MIEQPKGQEICQENEVADSILGPIDQLSKSSRTSAELNSRSRKLLKSIDFHKKMNSDAGAPFKRRGIESGPLSSSSLYPRLPAQDMNNPRPNSRPKKLNTWEVKKETITGDSTGEGEGYDMAINSSVLIIIM